jgi:hypothetical protein
MLSSAAIEWRFVRHTRSLVCVVSVCVCVTHSVWVVRMVEGESSVGVGVGEEAEPTSQGCQLGPVVIYHQ